MYLITRTKILFRNISETNKPAAVSLSKAAIAISPTFSLSIDLATNISASAHSLSQSSLKPEKSTKYISIRRNKTCIRIYLSLLLNQTLNKNCC